MDPVHHNALDGWAAFSAPMAYFPTMSQDLTASGLPTWLDVGLSVDTARCNSVLLKMNSRNLSRS